ncbi:MAG: AarF/ABC1/UbiB kinase family protein [Solirubrobacteraceae bacterium]|nr:AarF/ABC1/UbiB kinase family protein [Solirubrobacteraceae bacterium]
MPKIPTSRIGRTARFGSTVAGQGMKWAGTNAANRVRSDDKARAANEKRAMETAEELVARLGQMKGAAMKLGQVLSTVDFDLIPESEREQFKDKLASLRDNAPQVPFKGIEKVIKQDLGGKVSDHFTEFDENAIAAASIGQVYRATTNDGDDVAVKVQYPGVAEAVETDLRNMGMLAPLIKRLAPGLDAKAIMGELRERIGEELDYELEAQHQRTVGRALRGHPDVLIPAVNTTLSTRRVLVTEFVSGTGFGTIKDGDEESRDRFAEIVYRFFYGLLTHSHLAAGDPHPGNYLLADDGRVCFLDFGLMRYIPEDYLDGERALSKAAIDGDAEALHEGLATLGYLPDPAAFEPDRILEQIRAVGEWNLEPGFRRIDPEYVRQMVEVSSSPRSPYFDQMRMQTIPPQALLLRRMEGMLLSVLGELRAGADWGEIAREYYAGASPSTPLGERDAAHWNAVRG